MKIKRDEREFLQIPICLRPVLQFVAEILFEEFFQAGVVEPARVQLRRRFLRRKRLRLEMRAAREQNDSQNERPEFHAGLAAVSSGRRTVMLLWQ